GRDAAAAEALVNLRGLELDIREADVPTGLALIVVGATGDNQIVVVPGANAEVEASSVMGSVLCQLEVPDSAIAQARAGADWLCGRSDRSVTARRATVASDRGRSRRDTPPLMATAILLDCDPGHDDAIALLLALASPELELLGVTTVAGNQTLEKTTANAIRVLDFIGRDDVPVAAGADRPLTRDPFVAAYVHGETGLDGPDLPPPQRDPLGRHAADFLAEQIRERKGAVTLVPTGPLTNVALLLALH